MSSPSSEVTAYSADLKPGCIARGEKLTHDGYHSLIFTRRWAPASTQLHEMSVWRWPSRPSWQSTRHVYTLRDPEESPGADSDRFSVCSTEDADEDANFDGAVDVRRQPNYCLSETPSAIESIWCEDPAEEQRERQPTHQYVLEAVHQPEGDRRAPVPLLLRKGFREDNALESLEKFWRWAMSTYNVRPSTREIFFGLQTMKGYRARLKAGDDSTPSMSADDREALTAAHGAVEHHFLRDVPEAERQFP